MTNMGTGLSVFEQALNRLVGLPLSDIGRGGNIEMYSFGPERAVHDLQGRPRTVNQFALHIQCAWRLLGPNHIIVTSQDYYFPAGPDPEHIPNDFEYDLPNANRRDEQVNRFMAETALKPLVVKAVHMEQFGAFRLVFTDGYSLEVFPNSTLPTEQWRLFEPFSGEKHLVYFAVDR